MGVFIVKRKRFLRRLQFQVSETMAVFGIWHLIIILVTLEAHTVLRRLSNSCISERMSPSTSYSFGRPALVYSAYFMSRPAQESKSHAIRKASSHCIQSVA